MGSNHISAAVRIWNLVKGVSTADLERRIAMPVLVMLVGSPANVQAVTERLAYETPLREMPGDIQSVRRVTRAVDAGQSPVGRNDIAIDCDAAATSEAELARQMERIVDHHKKLRVAIAAAIPAMRPIVVDMISRDYSTTNAKIAAVSALPGIVPLGDIAMPLTAVGDIYLLTRNQMSLFLEIAAVYGLPPDLRARAREFAAVVGGAFLWRAAARQLVGIVPGGVGVVVKAGIAYAGTYAVGQAAALYLRRGGHRVGPREVTHFLRNNVKLLKSP